MAHRNVCITLCVTFLVLVHLIVGITFVWLTCEQISKETNFDSKSVTVYIVCLFLSVSDIISSLFLFVGLVWHQRQHIIAHFSISFVITSVIGASVVVIFLNDFGRRNWPLVTGFIISPLVVVCCLEYVVYMFYKTIPKSDFNTLDF